MQLSAR